MHLALFTTAAIFSFAFAEPIPGNYEFGLYQRNFLSAPISLAFHLWLLKPGATLEDCIIVSVHFPYRYLCGYNQCARFSVRKAVRT